MCDFHSDHDKMNSNLIHVPSNDLTCKGQIFAPHKIQALVLEEISPTWTRSNLEPDRPTIPKQTNGVLDLEANPFRQSFFLTGALVLATLASNFFAPLPNCKQQLCLESPRFSFCKILLGNLLLQPLARIVQRVLKLVHLALQLFR